ncbi:succinate dehydrogenase [ubiquinone] cytochrome b small subunit, mitochondrial [Protopterus annectens]|uniref:succinate dehydrogenase [ubiquinone] cytochrome b small subunit, mitochondrial n=1 Tax=Protopterus annectens TaxID=7888 RepID=UPI001CFACB57|nr:succinate dehydrogenase [ubiquinone] cytochrome b small subunit, mitochondrial [Protopterus annectens]
MASLVRLSSLYARGVKPLFLNRCLLARPLVASGSNNKESPALLLSRIHVSPNVYAVSKSASQHWRNEKALTVVLFSLFPAAFICPGPVVNYSLSAVIALHSYWGLENIITDYVHGSATFKMAKVAILALSATTFAGLCYFNYSDVGICKAVAMLWSI